MISASGLSSSWIAISSSSASRRWCYWWRASMRVWYRPRSRWYAWPCRAESLLSFHRDTRINKARSSSYVWCSTPIGSKGTSPERLERWTILNFSTRRWDSKYKNGGQWCLVWISPKRAASVFLWGFSEWWVCLNWQWHPWGRLSPCPATCILHFLPFLYFLYISSHNKT